MPLNNALLSEIHKSIQEKGISNTYFLVDKLIDETKSEDYPELRNLLTNLLHESANPKEQKMTEVQLAAKYGTAKVLDFLLETTKRAKFREILEPDILGTNAFVLSAISGYDAQQKIIIMLKHGGEIINEAITDNDGNTMLPISFVIKHNPKLLHFFLDTLKAETDSLTAIPPIYIAAVEKNEQAIDLLLQYGAKIDVNAGSANNPLVLAVSQNQFEAAALLLKKGAKLTGPTQLFLNYFEHIWDKKVFDFAVNLMDLHGLQFHHAEHIVNAKKIFDYLYSGNAVIDANRQKAFTKFPCLFELIRFTDMGVRLPNNIATAIDRGAGLTEELEKHYGVGQPTLGWLPAPYSEFVSASDLVILIKANILPPNTLPGYMQKAADMKREPEFGITSSANKKLKEDQMKMLNVLALCRLLTNEAFKYADNETLKKECFLSLVSSTINREKSKGKLFWQQTFDGLPEEIKKPEFFDELNYENTLRSIMSVVEDYMKCAILPPIIRAISASNLPPDEQKLILDPFWINRLIQITMIALFQQVPIDKIVEFAKYWSFHPAEVMRQSHKGLKDRDLTWEPFIPVTQMPPIPTDKFPEAKGWHIVPIASKHDLFDEAIRLDNCVASYLEGCYSGFWHFLTLHDENDKSISIVALVVNKDKKDSAYVNQHLGFHNKEILTTDLSDQIMRWFFAEIKDKVDFKHLEAMRLERIAVDDSMYEKAKVNVLFFDPMDMTQCALVMQDYRMAMSGRKSKESALHRNFDTLQYEVFSQLARHLQTWVALDENNNNADAELIPGMKFSRELAKFLYAFSQEMAKEHKSIAREPAKKEGIMQSILSGSFFGKTTPTSATTSQPPPEKKYK